MAGQILYGSRANVPKRSKWLQKGNCRSQIADFRLNADGQQNPHANLKSKIRNLKCELHKSALVRQPLPYILTADARDSYHFVPAGLAGRNGNGRAWHLQKFCKEFHASLIRTTFNRWSGQRQLQGFSQLARDRILFRARMHLNSKRDSLATLCNFDHGSTRLGHPSRMSRNECNRSTVITAILSR